MAKRCGECGRDTARLRKGRCDACYMRLYRGGEIPEGSTCAACGERRKSVLTHAEVGERRIILCGNCALMLHRARPRPETLDALLARARRERRRAPDRRRSFSGARLPDRRVGPRRAADRRSLPSTPSFDPAVD